MGIYRPAPDEIEYLKKRNRPRHSLNFKNRWNGDKRKKQKIVARIVYSQKRHEY